MTDGILATPKPKASMNLQSTDKVRRSNSDEFMTKFFSEEKSKDFSKFTSTDLPDILKPGTDAVLHTPE